MKRRGDGSLYRCRARAESLERRVLLAPGDAHRPLGIEGILACSGFCSHVTADRAAEVSAGVVTGLVTGIAICVLAPVG